MLTVLISPLGAGPGVARSAGAVPEDQRRSPIAVETVRPVRPAGAQPRGRRIALPAPERDLTAPPLRASAQRAAPFASTGRGADGTSRPSIPFLTQYIAQRLAPEPELDERQAKAALLAYRAGTERGITYFGFDAPLDLVI